MPHFNKSHDNLALLCVICAEPDALGLIMILRVAVLSVCLCLSVGSGNDSLTPTH